MADATTAAAGPRGHPAALTQHPHAQCQRDGGWRWFGVLWSQGGACREGQRSAATLLCSHGDCWSQVRFSIYTNAILLRSGWILFFLLGFFLTQMFRFSWYVHFLKKFFPLSFCFWLFFRPTDAEAEQLLQLMTSRPPATPAGVRFVSLSFCKLLAFPTLVRYIKQVLFLVYFGLFLYLFIFLDRHHSTFWLPDDVPTCQRMSLLFCVWSIHLHVKYYRVCIFSTPEQEQLMVMWLSWMIKEEEYFERYKIFYFYVKIIMKTVKTF